MNTFVDLYYKLLNISLMLKPFDVFPIHRNAVVTLATAIIETQPVEQTLCLKLLHAGSSNELSYAVSK